VLMSKLNSSLIDAKFFNWGGVTLPVRFIWTRGSTSKKIRLASIAIS
jgi:hypothetical protein